MYILDYLRQPNIASAIFRLLLAMVCGGVIGINRVRKGRAAGFRTYMIVCMGACLAMVLNQYMYLYNESLRLVLENGETLARTDAARLGAQVINGVGFLGAGTIIVTRTKEVQGVTTAAGLWASACMGLAVGAGFYECVFMGFIFIIFSLLSFTALEMIIMERSRNMNCYIEFDRLEDVQSIADALVQNGIHIYDIDIEGQSAENKRAQAVFYLLLNRHISHSDVLTAITKLDCVLMVEET